MTTERENRLAKIALTVVIVFIVGALLFFIVQAQTPGNNGSVILRWTNGGDYDSLNVASIPYSRVIIKMARDTITQANYLTKPDYLQSHKPTAPGQADSLLITGLTDNRDWFFTVLGVDSAGNVSPYFPAIRKRSSDGTKPSAITGWR